MLSIGVGWSVPKVNVDESARTDLLSVSDLNSDKTQVLQLGCKEGATLKANNTYESVGEYVWACVELTDPAATVTNASPEVDVPERNKVVLSELTSRFVVTQLKVQ